MPRRKSLIGVLENCSLGDTDSGKPLSCWQSQSGAYEDIGQHVVKVLWREFQLTVIHVKKYLTLKKELS